MACELLYWYPFLGYSPSANSLENHPGYSSGNFHTQQPQELDRLFSILGPAFFITFTNNKGAKRPEAMVGKWSYVPAGHEIPYTLLQGARQGRRHTYFITSPLPILSMFQHNEIQIPRPRISPRISNPLVRYMETFRRLRGLCHFNYHSIC